MTREKRKITRRESILFGLGGLVAAIATFCWRPRSEPRRPRRDPAHTKRVAAAIRDHFHYLDLDPEGVERFVEDWERIRGRIVPERVPAMKYLLSTDFFMHGADEKRTVHYVTVFDPYASPCFNPMRPTEG